jgi:UDP-N-acetylglucosamine transferase subunit ALG13
VWVTYDGAQARSLLADVDVRYVPYIGAREPRKVLAGVREARSMLRDLDVAEVVTTGSQVALSFALPAAPARIPFHFIESAARFDGPSLTGRMIRRLPGVTYYSQYRKAESAKVHFGGSVLEGFRSSPGPSRPIKRAVVTLGTFRGYGFRRLVTNVLRVLPPDVEVLWQTGDTDVSGLPIEGHHEIPSMELTAAMAEADVVITHAGVGSALAALQVGRLPLLVPRRLHHQEHVDDHQTQIATTLSEAGLAATADADALSLELFEQIAGTTIDDDGGPTFDLTRQ